MFYDELTNWQCCCCFFYVQLWPRDTHMRAHHLFLSLFCNSIFLRNLYDIFHTTDADVSKDRRSTDLFLKGLFLSNFENNDIKQAHQWTNAKRNSNRLPDTRSSHKLFADFSKFTTKYDAPKTTYTDHNFDGVKIISRFSISSLNSTEKDTKSLDTTKTTFYLAQAAPFRTIDLTYKQREHHNKFATPTTIAPTATSITTTTTDTTTATSTSTTTTKPFLIQIY